MFISLISKLRLVNVSLNNNMKRSLTGSLQFLENGIDYFLKALYIFTSKPIAVLFSTRLIVSSIRSLSYERVLYSFVIQSEKSASIFLGGTWR